jgi:2-dehydro-3-deoxyphosphooctonate aldolase (KDO 8-P synthase)
MNKKLDLFIGLCVLESADLADEVAATLIESLKPFKDKINFSFKGSFDKANRTSINSFRGPGLEEGLKILSNIKDKYKIPVTTDFHQPEQANPVASIVDTLQVPAFLCRQTDMIMAGANAAKKYGRQLKIKKGQFLSPHDAKNIVEKAASVLSLDKILLTERGSSFGYNNLIVDMASFQIMKSFGVRAIHDATHCVQRPGGLGNITGGKREQIEVLAKAAIASGADGVFLETHPDPAKALSDSTTAMPLKDVPVLISKLLKIFEAVNS